MIKGIKLYWILFFVGVLLLSVLSIFEQKQIEDTNAQIENGFEKVQQIIRSKELKFIDLVQSNLISDTNNLTRNWTAISKLLAENNVNLFINKNDTLVYWSTTEISNNQVKFPDKHTNTVIKGKNGWYLAYRQQRGNYMYSFTYLIKQNFSYRNQYLQNNFNNEFDFIEEAIVVNKKINDRYFEVVSITGKPLFYIQIISLYKNTKYSLLLALLAVLVFCVVLGHILLRHYICIVPTTTTITYFIVILWLRVSNTLYSVPHFLYNLKLFDPSIYASSAWFPSLGDLLIDSILVFWYFFILENWKNHPRYIKRKITLIEIVWNIILSMLASSIVFASIRSIAIDSQISFDISKIYNINIFTLFALLACVIQLLTVYFICRNTSRAIKKYEGRTDFLILTIAVCLIPLIGLIFWQNDFNIENSIGIIGLALVFILFKLFTSRINRFQQYFIVIVFISAYTAYFIRTWDTIRESNNRKLFAVKQVSQTDITNDYFLRGVAEHIREDEYVKNYFKSPFISKKQFEKRIKQLYFTGYLGRFDIELLDYDGEGNHFKERNELAYRQVNKLYDEQAKESFAEEFRYMQNSGSIRGYLGKFVVRDGVSRLGYLYVVLRPRLIQNENRFDEILVEGNAFGKQKEYEYSYAVYKDKKLVYQNGDFAYSIINTWGESDGNFKYFTENEFSHLLYTNPQLLTVVVSKSENHLSQTIGLFSFIFTGCTVVLILVLLMFVTLNSQWLKQRKIANVKFIQWIRNNILKLLMIDSNQIVLIRTRIQSSIIFIVFTTLVFSSYFTIQFITDKYNQRQSDRLLKKLRNIVINIENERIALFNAEITKNEIEALINQFADFYDTDIILFDARGNVLASSVSKLYDENIVGSSMNPMAFFHLKLLKESQFSQNETIGNLTFQAVYAPVFSSRNEAVGYLQLPYFTKHVDLLNEISSVVIGFINLYVLLFIIIVIIAYWVSRNISYPLTLVQQRLSNTSLGGGNEPIVWQRDDEIGELVKQYNRMILELDASAKKIAETERQGAWREIARQVAHEIKNPLTPMKLSIQHLQRAYANNDVNIGEKIKRTSDLLIAQIDILSDMASEFSSFAKMPTPNYEIINLNKLLSQVINLYSEGNNHQFTLYCNKEVSLFFDYGYLNRAVSNLVKNALQAMPESESCAVQIEVIESNDVIKIFVKDNAKGMTDEQAAKIFTPYFSTKVTGMGLGLPIVKNMIESGGGTISFTTQFGVGTEFCITLPKRQPA